MGWAIDPSFCFFWEFDFFSYFFPSSGQPKGEHRILVGIARFSGSPKGTAVTKTAAPTALLMGARWAPLGCLRRVSQGLGSETMGSSCFFLFRGTIFKTGGVVSLYHTCF